jgi:hypothetical protein
VKRSKSWVKGANSLWPEAKNDWPKASQEAVQRSKRVCWCGKWMKRSKKKRYFFHFFPLPNVDPGLSVEKQMYAWKQRNSYGNELVSVQVDTISEGLSVKPKVVAPTRTLSHDLHDFAFSKIPEEQFKC